MKRFLVRILSTLLLFITVFQMVEAQTMHVTLFVNEEEKPVPPDYVDRRPDRRADMSNMYEFFKTIANTIGYGYSCTRNSDNLFTSAQVMSEMRRLQRPGVVGPNDIVVFYYGGHGYNDLSNQWPTLALLDYNTKKCRQTDVKGELDKIPIKPKLVLCIVACCNNIHYSRGSVGNTDPLPIGSDPVAIKKLFTGFSGKASIMISSSKQGQVSYSYTSPSPILGSIFGICLRRSIYGVDMYSDWNKVLEKARLMTMDLTKEPTKFQDGQQQPQYEIEVEVPQRIAVVKSFRLVPDEIQNGENSLGIHVNLEAWGYNNKKLLVSAYLESVPGKSVKSPTPGGPYATSNCQVGVVKSLIPDRDGFYSIDLYIPNNKLYIPSAGTYYVKVCVFDGNSLIHSSEHNSVYLSLGKTPEQWYNEAVQYFQKSDFVNAYSCYSKAADNGHTYAQQMVGYCYYNGKGVTINYGEAVKWFRKSAEKGNSYGQVSLGICYLNGKGVTKDCSEAVSWFSKSALQGNSEAQKQLGYCYENGLGVTINISLAVAFYRKAAAQGDTFAKDRLKALGY